MEKDKKSKTVDVKCPNGFLIGYDFACYPDCSPKCSMLWTCAVYKKSCIDKADFGSETIARIEAAKMKEPYKEYECRFCGGWHIGRNWD